MPSEPFNLDQLRLIALIDEQRSFSRAAGTLGISQSAVSQQVRTVEQALGRRLFRRAAAGIAPTSDGEAYLVYARAMLAIGAEAKRHFLNPASEGEIRLGLTEDFARTALPGVLALFSRDHPRFEFIVDCGLSAALITGFTEGRYDIVVAKRSAGEAIGEKLWSEPLAWYGRDDTPVPVADPVQLALIPAPSVSREAMLRALQKAGRPWRVAFQSLSFGAVEAVVQAGIGISAFGQHFSAPGLVELADSGLPPLGTVEVCMGRSERSGSEAQAAFCALIRQAALLLLGPKDDGAVP